MAINFLTVEGNITREPELKFPGNSGRAVLSFGIAHTPRKLNRNTNEWEDGTTLFLDVAIWGRPAEAAADTLRKGQKVIVAGDLAQQNWDDKNTGEKRSKITLNAASVSTVPKSKQQGNSSWGSAPDNSPF